VAATARNARKKDLARKIGEDYLKRVEAGSTMAQAAEAMKLPHREFGPFSRVNPPLTDPVVVGTAFGLEAGQRSGMLDTEDGLYVVQSVERVKADSAQFVKELDAYRSRVIQLARQDRVRGFLGALRESAKVVDNRAQLQQQQQQQAAARAGHLNGPEERAGPPWCGLVVWSTGESLGLARDAVDWGGGASCAAAARLWSAHDGLWVSVSCA
jgi:hypothetical protein